MKLKEEPLKHELIYDGTVVRLYRDEARMPDGTVAPREVVCHPGGVTVAMEDEQGSFFLVRQWRYAQGREMIEFPAGKREPGEAPLETAIREIKEETGYEGTDFRYLGEIVPTGAYDSEVIHMYTCKKGAYTGQKTDPDEYLEVMTRPLDEIEELVHRHLITDAKTIIAMYFIKQVKQEETQ